jgi:hypothetical protein
MGNRIIAYLFENVAQFDAALVRSLAFLATHDDKMTLSSFRPIQVPSLRPGKIHKFSNRLALDSQPYLELQLPRPACRDRHDKPT